MRVRAVFVAWMLAVVGAATVGTAIGLAARVQDLRAAQTAGANVEALSAALRVVEALAVERGGTNAALRRPEPTTPERVEALEFDRARTDTALALTLAYLHRLAPVTRDVPIADVQQLAHRIRETRRTVDRQIALPASQRDASFIAGFIPSIVNLLDEYARLENVLEGAVARSDPTVGQFASVARVASDLRDFAGRAGNIHIDLIATGGPISNSAAEQLAEMRGRVDQSWSRIRALIEQAGADTELETEIHTVEFEYFGGSRKLYGLVVDATNGLNTTLTVDDLRMMQYPVVQRVLTLRDAALKIAAERSDARRLSAMRALITVAGMALLTLGVGALAVAMFGRRVVFPILALTRTIVRIAEGKREVDIPHRDREDEIGQMGNALETLRHNALAAEQAAKQHAERLEEARSAAEGASRAKSAFLATMSHELRTPLNAVIGFAEMIEREIVGPVGAPAYIEYARDIHESASHLLQLINDILDLSTLEAGHLVLSEEKVDLRQTLQASVRMLAPRAEAGQIAMSIEIEFDSTPVVCDERRIRQVALNLLANAVKYTQPGGRVIARLGRDRDGSVLLSFEDNGIGIAETDLTLVMAPFGRAETAFNRTTEGTGLGLPLTKRLVEAHGGELILDSSPGKGTTATVRLPAWRARSDVAAA
jgi:signal transduction histidine kinase